MPVARHQAPYPPLLLSGASEGACSAVLCRHHHQAWAEASSAAAVAVAYHPEVRCSLAWMCCWRPWEGWVPLGKAELQGREIGCPSVA